MRDAIGGSVVIAIIVVFVVLVLSYLAFNVNYTKAFRMKNKIIATYEEFDGNCNGSIDVPDDSTCQGIIAKYAKEIGYTPTNLVCPGSPWKAAGRYYCYKEVTVSQRTDATKSVNEYKDKKYYKIGTIISIDIPIVKNLIPFSMFQITGDTKSFLVKK